MKKVERITKVIVAVVLIATIFLIGYALLNSVDGDPYIGSFDAVEMTDGWIYRDFDDGNERNVSLPVRIPEKKGHETSISNVLPLEIDDGMIIMTRTSGHSLTVLIDGEVRQSYVSEKFFRPIKNLPSAYIAVNLTAEDAGKTIEYVFKAIRNGKGKYNEVWYGYGNNAWYKIIKANAPVLIVSILLLIVGIAAIFISYIMGKSRGRMSVLYLALSLLITGMWMIAESEIRQIIFQGPYLSSIFSYTLLESLGVLLALYFDSIQKQRYHKYYVIVEAVMACQLLINCILEVLWIAEFHNTLIFSHVTLAIAILIALWFLFKDFKSGMMREYSTIAAGMMIMLGLCVVEITSFYMFSFYELGVFLGIGLVVLLSSTIIQNIKDEIADVEKRRVQSEKMTEATIQTIANTIDAKDEYTGGHSDRVGRYAKALCREAAKEFGLTEEDQFNIEYIGRMHDIGKIGVPDYVLNKKGRLDEEEYILMQKHTIIGDEILSGIDNVYGMHEGVRYHHERWDGKGYPDGLKGEEIPIYARILCIADAYDAMTSDRIYRKRLPMDKVIDELRKGKGSQFDPRLTDIFLNLVERGYL